MIYENKMSYFKTIFFFILFSIRYCKTVYKPRMRKYLITRIINKDQRNKGKLV